MTPERRKAEEACPSNKACPPPLTRCPQCLGMWCGPISCKYTGLHHKTAIDAAMEGEKQ